MLYDVSSSYLEGRCCPLGRRGHSRDGKKGKLQIVYGLLCNAEGCPVAVEVYAGNTGDPATLADQIRKVRARFGLARVVFVGDRGMLTSARIDEELRPVEGLDWVSALRSNEIARLARDRGPLQPSLFDTRDLAEVRHPDFPGERLIACLNPLLRDERRRSARGAAGGHRGGPGEDRARGGAAHPHAADAGGDRPEGRPGAGAAQDGQALRLGGHARRPAALLARHRADRRRGAPRRHLRDPHLGARDGPRHRRRGPGPYKALATVERAFRCLKTVDLHLRPIHHRRSERVRAHVFLCMLAYYVEWHMRRAWAPLLFAEDDPADAARRHGSPVAKATPSASATAKAETRRTPEGLPVHHFRGLLDHLATLTRNTVQVHGAELPFQQLTVPTDLQRRAFELLNVRIAV